jgi:hypothetical protein
VRLRKPTPGVDNRRGVSTCRNRSAAGGRKSTNMHRVVGLGDRYVGGHAGSDQNADPATAAPTTSLTDSEEVCAGTRTDSRKSCGVRPRKTEKRSSSGSTTCCSPPAELWAAVDANGVVHDLHRLRELVQDHVQMMHQLFRVSLGLHLYRLDRKGDR